jgi:cell wall-associated NlpC family hydrolase
MQMMYRQLTFTVACLLILQLDSCHTGKKSVSRKSSDPQFINGVYINPHGSWATANTIDKNRKQAKPGKHTKTSRAATTKSPATQPATPVTANKISDPKQLQQKYARMLGVAPKALSNITLYKFIENWFGTAYRFGGTDQSGIDCSSFAKRLYGEVYGIDLVRTAMDQFASCEQVNAKRATEGDLVFFSIDSKGITHVGIYLINNFFVHASTSGGVAINSLNEDYWHKYYAGMGRVPKG